MPNEELTPTVAPAPGAPAEEKVTFSPEQQDKLSEIIKGVSARAGAEARQRAADLEKELAALKAAQTPAAEELTTQLALTKAELIALKKSQEAASLKESLRLAAGDLFVDTELATRLMADSVRVGADGKPVVVDANGEVALDSDFKPLSLAGLAQRVATERKFLAKSRYVPGSGSTPTQSNGSAQPRIEDLFGRKSSGALAQKLARENIQLYRKMRSEAQSRGLL